MASSRDDQTKPHLSSLVVRSTDTVAADYEPGEVRPDIPPHSRHHRFSDQHHGYRTRAVSGSPTRNRDADRRYNTDFHRPVDLRHGRGFGGGRAAVRSPGRHRDFSPHARGRGTGRPFAKPLDDPDFGSGRFRGEGRNNPNVRPREGDWYCPDPECRNLNFARREHCNSCSCHRYATIRSPRRGYGGGAPIRSPRRGYGGEDAPIRSPRRGYGGPPSPVALPRRFPGPPVDRFPGRFMDGYRSPPHGFPPREVGFPGPLPPPRHEIRLPPDHHHHLPRDRLDHLEDEFRERAMFSRPPPPDWLARGDRGRDIYNDRRVYDRLPVSPPNGRWADRDMRERSRSPFRGIGALPAPPPKDFRHDLYMERGRDDRRGTGRDPIGRVY